MNFNLVLERTDQRNNQLLKLQRTLKKSVDNNMYTCGIFLDFAKAFDTVNHEILLNKLQQYGIRGVPLDWFTSYLENRKQYVELKVKSNLQQIICGVPQGSSLGPLLFLIYINDISNCSDSLSFRIFADDTTLFASSNNMLELEHLLNHELVKVSN